MKINNNDGNNNAFTTRYSYGNHDSEYVFTCKGRPFAVLVSDNIPTPTSTLLDFDLVKSLGLKVTDLQCRKFSFAGNKLRILGRVSTAVQCLDEGKVSGNYHIKGFVVSDLNTLLDTHCVASLRMRQQMATKETIIIPDDDEDNCTYSGAFPPAAVSRSPPPAAAVKPPPPARTPPRAPRSPPRAPRSPPGFPPTPQYRSSASAAPHTAAAVPVCRVAADGRQMSPRAANIRALGSAFNNADLKTDTDEVTWALEEVESEGDIEDDGYDFTLQLRNGLKYNYGHGRNRCSFVKCTDPDQFAVQGFPSNCAFNKAWWFPDKFKPCGDQCEGAWCFCLRWYQPGFPVYQPLNQDEEERRRRGERWKDCANTKTCSSRS